VGVETSEAVPQFMEGGCICRTVEEENMTKRREHVRA
jgi:hypothetical protein